MTATLAKGADLTPETWADFVARLHHDCVGEGVRDHCTADATFLVQKRIFHIVPEEHAEGRRIGCDGESESPEEFFEGLSEEQQAALNTATGGCFVASDNYDMEAALKEHHPDATLWHYTTGWEFVCQHFTKDAAEAFIARKKHDYRDGLRVFVDCTYYSWELNTIKAAILSGQIAFINAETAQSKKED